MAISTLSPALFEPALPAVSPTASPPAGSPAARSPAGGTAAFGAAAGPSLPSAQRLALIRERLARLSAVPGEAGVVALGVAPLDAALPGGGLGLAGLHRLEAAAEWDGPAAAGFALALAERVRREAPGRAGRPIVWIGPAAPHAPGLLSLGLEPERLLLVRAAGEADQLWALEEVLRSAQAAAALCSLRGLDRLAGRRLQLAAERSATPALVLESRSTGEPVAALSRWRITARPALDPDRPAWRLELLQARGGTPATAEVDWTHATAAFALAAPLRDRVPAAG
jgi:protein ImuA